VTIRFINQKHVGGKLWHLGREKYGGLKGFYSAVHPSRRFSAALDILNLVPATLPTSVDLSAILPPNDNQGNVGRCGPFTFVHWRESLQLKAKHALQPLDPDALYYQYRLVTEPSEIDQDTGIVNTLMASLVESFGIPLAADGQPLDPVLDVAPLTWKQRWDAHNYANVSMFQLQTPDDMLKCLAAGYPFVLGLTVFDSFFDVAGTSNPIPMPTPDDQVAGGHDMEAYKYMPDPTGTYTRLVVCRNQWGDFTPGDDIVLPWEFVVGSDPVNGPWTGDCWTGWLESDPNPNV
jgi:hypothetical protein